MSVTDAVGDAAYFAYGFHGTTDASAAAIRRTGYFKPSDHSFEKGEGDWLGPGFYLWQDAPTRVWEWLRDGHHPADFQPPFEVVVAKVQLTRCLDLLDTRDQALLRDAFDGFAQGLPPGQPMPSNPTDTTVPAWHPLDDAIVREVLARSKKYGPRIHSMRAPFREGDPIYTGSALHALGHVQIAVFQQAAVIDYHCEDAPPGWFQSVQP